MINSIFGNEVAPSSLTCTKKCCGIKEITSIDGTVTIVDPTGEVTDLSVSGTGSSTIVTGSNPIISTFNGVNTYDVSLIPAHFTNELLQWNDVSMAWELQPDDTAIQLGDGAVALPNSLQILTGNNRMDMTTEKVVIQSSGNPPMPLGGLPNGTIGILTDAGTNTSIIVIPKGHTRHTILMASGNDSYSENTVDVVLKGILNIDGGHFHYLESVTTNFTSGSIVNLLGITYTGLPSFQINNLRFTYVGNVVEYVPVPADGMGLVITIKAIITFGRQNAQTEKCEVGIYIANLSQKHCKTIVYPDRYRLPANNGVTSSVEVLMKTTLTPGDQFYPYLEYQGSSPSTNLNITSLHFFVY